MAIQILPQVPQRPDYSFWGNFGRGFSRGLGQLAQSKLQEFQQRRTQESQRESLRKLGLPDSVVDFVQTLPPEQQLEYAISYHQGQQQEPQQQGGLDALLGMGGQPMAQQDQQGEQNQLQDILGALGGPQQAQGLEQFLSPQQGKSLRMQQAFGQQAPMQEAPQVMAPAQQPQAPAPKLGGAQEFFQTVARGRTKPGGMTAKELQAERKLQADAFKATADTRKEIVSGARGARDNLTRLARMEELNNKGSLNKPGYVSLLDKVGLDYPALLKPDSQEFNKLSVDFLKDARAIFGGRITNYEAEQFLKSIPTLGQTKEGRERVIRNLKIMNQGALLRQDAMRDVVRENGGYPPYDLDDRIEQRIEPQLNELSKDFAAGAKQVQSERKVGSTFNQLPPARDFNAGDELTDDNGKVFRNTGTQWVKVR